LDIAALNAFILWSFLNPEWFDKIPPKKARKIFLQKLGYELAQPHIEARAQKIEEQKGFGAYRSTVHAIEATGRQIQTVEGCRKGKRGRCFLCEYNHNKFSTYCQKCEKWICKDHSRTKTETICFNCT